MRAQETYFRPDPARAGMVTTKTPVEQETACFLDDGTNLGELPYLRSIMHLLPTHLILGDVMDIWYAFPLLIFLLLKDRINAASAYCSAKAEGRV